MAISLGSTPTTSTPGTVTSSEIGPNPYWMPSRAMAWPGMPAIGRGVTPAYSGRASRSATHLPAALPRAGSVKPTPLPAFSTAMNLGRVEISGWGAPAFTARPKCTRPTGLVLPGRKLAATSLNCGSGRMARSPGTMFFTLSRARVTVPPTMVTFLPVSASHLAASARRPGLVPPEVRTVMSAHATPGARSAVQGIISSAAASMVLSFIPGSLFGLAALCTPLAIQKSPAQGPGFLPFETVG